jgi:hypothetical protein
MLVRCIVLYVLHVPPCEMLVRCIVLYVLHVPPCEMLVRCTVLYVLHVPPCEMLVRCTVLYVLHVPPCPPHLSTSLGAPSSLALPGVVMMMGPISPAYGSAASFTWLQGLRGGGGQGGGCKPVSDRRPYNPLALLQEARENAAVKYCPAHKYMCRSTSSTAIQAKQPLQGLE